MPYSERLAFWRRTKARLAERRRERAEQDARESQPIKEWAGVELEADAVTGDHLVAGSIVWTEANDDFREREGMMRKDVPDEYLFDGVHPFPAGARQYIDSEFAKVTEQLQSPISSARRTLTRDMVEAKILNNVVDVDEVFWDVVSMIDAHRNGATALDRDIHLIPAEKTPLWDETTELLWDPSHERGPRERDYVRQQHRRTQPTNKSRRQRKGKKR